MEIKMLIRKDMKVKIDRDRSIHIYYQKTNRMTQVHAIQPKIIFVRSD